MNLRDLFPFRIVSVDELSALETRAGKAERERDAYRAKYHAANTACKALIMAGVKRPKKARRPVKRPSVATRATRAAMEAKA